MQPRSIVQELSSGRYIIDGTPIFVAEIKKDFRASGDAMRAPYESMGVSPDELDAAIAFEFTKVRDVSIAPKLVAFDMYCECGEQRPTFVTPPALTSDACICGRRWHISLNVEPVRTDQAA